jgi:hypothetical protein
MAVAGAMAEVAVAAEATCAYATIRVQPCCLLLLRGKGASKRAEETCAETCDS